MRRNRSMRPLSFAGSLGALVAWSVLLTTTVTPAVAQPVQSSVGPGAGLPVEGTMPVLYDQTANQSTNGFGSQDFTDAGGGNDAFDSLGADDFLVTDGQIWSISEVDVPGFLGAGAPGPVDSVDVTFYEDAGGTPGAALCMYDDVVPAAQVAGALSITLPSPCNVPPGMAWLSVQANLPSTPNGQWFWFLESVQTFSEFVWENPNDGFMTGCTSFMPGTTCGASDPDLSFVLRGVVRSDIPTLSTVSLGALALLLALGAMVALRRRQVA